MIHFSHNTTFDSIGVVETFGLNTVSRARMIAEIAQLGERQTEDLKVACSIHAFGISFSFLLSRRRYEYFHFKSGRFGDNDTRFGDILENCKKGARWSGLAKPL